MSGASAIFFDLDGTLVDSAPAILASYRNALAIRNLSPRESLTRALIGPPLLTALRRLSGIEDPAILQSLAETFKAHYDGSACLDTEPYPGVPEILARLSEAGRSLFVLTNKRMTPTRRILEHLDLERHFLGIHTLDGEDRPLASKGELLGKILSSRGLAPGESVVVGDTADDHLAALDNGVRFIHAAYGYGSPAPGAPEPAATIDSISRLPEHL